MASDVSRKADTKARIVAATVAALQRGGLPPLSYDAVAQEAGMTRQAVRYHFPDHEALMVATCDRLADAYRAALIENAARLQGPHRLDMFLDFYFDLLDGTPKPRDDAAYDAMMSLATRWPGCFAAIATMPPQCDKLIRSGKQGPDAGAFRNGKLWARPDPAAPIG